MNPLYFLWDYTITEDKIHTLLKGNNETERLWIISRILSHARFEDVWNYLKISDIVSVFPKLRLPSKIDQAWRHALTVWGYHV